MFFQNIFFLKTKEVECLQNESDMLLTTPQCIELKNLVSCSDFEKNYQTFSFGGHLRVSYHHQTC